MRSLFLLTIGLATVAGCNKVSGPNIKTLPVSGKVVLQGQPLSTGRVWFAPDESKGNKSTHHARGEIDAEGRYVLYTEEVEGAPPGWYKVAVSATAATDAKPGTWSPPVSLIPEKYAMPISSGLAVEVVETPAAGAYDLKLTK